MRTAFLAPGDVAALLCSTAVIGLFATPAPAASFTTLHKFCSKADCIDGGNPLQSPLIPDSAGNFFGTAQNGGEVNGGVFYELIGGTTYKKQFDFPANVSPRGPLVRDINGNFYGIEGTGNTGAGGIFRLLPNAKGTKWSFETLYTFCASGGSCPDGQAPVELTYTGASSGTSYDGRAPLYGTSIFGGASGDGTAFQLQNKRGQWQESVLYSFCSQTSCADGMWPSYGLLADATGTLFGTTTAGGNSSGQGVVFRLTHGKRKGAAETVLYSFCHDANCTDGAQPSGLAADGSGKLYGTTATGGDAAGGFSGGVIYRLAPNGRSYAYSRLYSFCQQPSCADGDGPLASMIIGPSGTLYGTTAGDSRVFSFAPQTETYAVLHAFCMNSKCRDGFDPQSPLALDASGHLLGNTSFGGSDLEGGTIFEVTP